MSKKNYKSLDSLKTVENRIKTGKYCFKIPRRTVERDTF